MVGPKKQDFWPKINIFKRNHCILRIGERQFVKKVGMILEKAISILAENLNSGRRYLITAVLTILLIEGVSCNNPLW